MKHTREELIVEYCAVLQRLTEYWQGSPHDVYDAHHKRVWAQTFYSSLNAEERQLVSQLLEEMCRQPCQAPSTSTQS